MKKIKCDDIEHVLLTEEEYSRLIDKADHKAYIIAGIEVEIHIPFEQCMCVNWDDSHNFRGYTGIIFKEERISTSQLKNILDIYREDKGRSTPFPKHFNGKAFLDGRDLERDLPTIKRIVDFIEDYVNPRPGKNIRDAHFKSGLCQ